MDNPPNCPHCDTPLFTIMVRAVDGIIVWNSTKKCFNESFSEFDARYYCESCEGELEIDTLRPIFMEVK